MTEQLKGTSMDVLPLRLDEEIRRDEEQTQEGMNKEVKKLSREGSFSRANRPEYEITYHINETDIGFEDVLDKLNGINSKVLDKNYDREGSKDVGYIGDNDNDLRRYMEWLFLPDEVFDVREVDLMVDSEMPAWNETYWVAGYSTAEGDRQEFGPFNSFEGPPLNYAMVCINDEDTNSLYDYSVVETSKYHPQAKLDQYTEDGSFPQEVLKEGPDTLE
jgi:hypothetical protein